MPILMQLLTNPIPLKKHGDELLYLICKCNAMQFYLDKTISCTYARTTITIQTTQYHNTISRIPDFYVCHLYGIYLY
jgi:hypothetical protein